LRAIRIPASVVSIGRQAFSVASSLVNVIFEPGSSLIMIGASAFQQTALRTITIPASVEQMGWRVFTGAKQLANVMFEKGSQLKSIEYGTFADATALKTIDIPPSVTNIDERAFSGATNLEKVTFLPVSNLNRIGDDAFADTSLKLVVMGKPALGRLNDAIDLNDAAAQPIHFGDGNTFYGKEVLVLLLWRNKLTRWLMSQENSECPLARQGWPHPFLPGSPLKKPKPPKQAGVNGQPEKEAEGRRLSVAPRRGRLAVVRIPADRPINRARL
jgi:hypothetical protein